MDGIFYIVFRIFFKGAEETHSTQYFTDKRQATQRFYNIVASELADPAVTYQYADIRDSNGSYVDGINPVIYDRRPEPNAE